VTLIPRAGGDLPFVLTLMYGLLAYFAIAAGIKTLLNPSTRDSLSVAGPLWNVTAVQA